MNQEYLSDFQIFFFADLQLCLNSNRIIFVLFSRTNCQLGLLLDRRDVQSFEPRVYFTDFSTIFFRGFTHMVKFYNLYLFSRTVCRPGLSLDRRDVQSYELTARSLTISSKSIW